MYKTCVKKTPTTCKKMKRLICSAAALALFAGPAMSQSADVPDNLEKLSNFKTTGVTEFTYIDQGGDYAEGIKKILANDITVPDGFKIEAVHRGA